MFHIKDALYPEVFLLDMLIQISAFVLSESVESLNISQTSASGNCWGLAAEHVQLVDIATTSTA